MVFHIAIAVAFTDRITHVSRRYVMTIRHRLFCVSPLSSPCINTIDLHFGNVTHTNLDMIHIVPHLWSATWVVSMANMEKCSLRQGSDIQPAERQSEIYPSDMLFAVHAVFELQEVCDKGSSHSLCSYN